MRSIISPRRRLFAVALPIVAMVVALTAQMASAAPPVKRDFSADLQPVPATTDAVPELLGNTSVGLTFTISVPSTNTQPLGSANVTVPAGFTSISGLSVTASWDTQTRTWTASSVSGQTLQLRSGSNANRIPAGRSGQVNATFTVTTPDVSAATEYAFNVLVQQSTNFTDNVNFTPVAGAGTATENPPRVKVVPAGVPLEPGESFTFPTTNFTSATFTLSSGSGTFEFSSTPCEGDDCIGSEVTVNPHCPTGCRGLLKIQYDSNTLNVSAADIGNGATVEYKKPGDDDFTEISMCSTGYTGGTQIGNYNTGNPQGTIDGDIGPFPCMWKFLQTGQGSNKLELQIVIDGEDPTLRTR